ncbi:hypothetical protein PR048_030664 [Dryococelus australis]|uniref:Uncharacterized protein n=1 Tax=Dryococelus australis TaxID=614101 RepID=A0ABQ9G9K0_9NEOP|nr:hypothetical protein PR048_030664 [Dryococelus australis]
MKIVRNYATSGPDVDHGSLASTTPDISDEKLEDKKSAFLESLKLPDEDRKKLCQDTVLQTQSFLWQTERRKRITTSWAGKICKMRDSTANKSKTVLPILYSDFSGTRATKYGIEKEELGKYVLVIVFSELDCG